MIIYLYSCIILEDVTSYYQWNTSFPLICYHYMRYKLIYCKKLPALTIKLKKPDSEPLKI